MPGAATGSESYSEAQAQPGEENGRLWELERLRFISIYLLFYPFLASKSRSRGSSDGVRLEFRTELLIDSTDHLFICLSARSHVGFNGEAGQRPRQCHRLQLRRGSPPQALQEMFVYCGHQLCKDPEQSSGGGEAATTAGEAEGDAER